MLVLVNNATLCSSKLNVFFKDVSNTAIYYYCTILLESNPKLFFRSFPELNFPLNPLKTFWTRLVRINVLFLLCLGEHKYCSHLVVDKEQYRIIDQLHQQRHNQINGSGNRIYFSWTKNLCFLCTFVHVLALYSCVHTLYSSYMTSSINESNSDDCTYNVQCTNRFVLFIVLLLTKMKCMQDIHVLRKLTIIQFWWIYLTNLWSIVLHQGFLLFYF